MGGNHIESQRALIAQFCPAGTGTDGAVTSADMTSLCLNVPNETSALYSFKLKCKHKCVFLIHSFFFFLSGCSTVLAQSKYISWIHLISVAYFQQFLLTLEFRRAPDHADFIAVAGKTGL